ncbi:UNVERIFIED_ORG: hypothetical protein ABIC77_000325 [Stenotrophomonas geniculata]
MFVLFAGHMIRVDHVSAISVPLDTGAEGNSSRYRVTVYLLGGFKVEGHFAEEGEAHKHYVAFKGAVGA